MTLRDKYSFSLHTIKNNKARSILTIIISAFLSTLVMGLLCLSVSFGINGNDILNKVYFAQDSIVDVTYSNSYNRSTVATQKVFTRDLYQPFVEVLNKHAEVVSYVRYSSSARNNFLYTEPLYPLSIGYDIVEGRGIAPSASANEVIVSQSYYSEMLKGGIDLSVGSVHEDYGLYEKMYVGGRIAYLDTTYKYVVVGIFRPNGKEYTINGSKGTILDAGINFIADIGVALNANEEIYIPNIRISYKSSVDKVDSGAIFSEFKSMQNDMNKILPKAIQVTSGGFEPIIDEVDPCNCKAYEEYEALNKFKFIFIGGAAGIGLVLLLMSIGSLANSVMISIDRSKKFIGLLKALGVRGRSLKAIITYESITLISVGVLIGFGVLFALSGPLNMIETALVNSMYGTYVQTLGFTSSFYIPFYVLLGTIAVFVLLTLLFSRGSLRKISKTDPIAVISEVS